MQVRFTKMHGAGNDFVMLDETQRRYDLASAQYRWLADRHFGVGADQILSVRPSPQEGIDFAYVIHNADGAEVEQCGNGARCFVRFVRDQGLTRKSSLRVLTKSGVIEPSIGADGLVSVNMGEPVFELSAIPFLPPSTKAAGTAAWQTWPITLEREAVQVAVVSMGNPHAVQIVADVDLAPVARQGPLMAQQRCFPNQVNAGFMQLLSRQCIKLRVFERGTGETLACGSGACAAVVAGIRLGLLDATVEVRMRGGVLRVSWAGAASPVHLAGPAVRVFSATVEIPETC